MPIFVHVNFKQEPLFCRGHRVGIFRSLCLFLRLPTWWRSQASEDAFCVPSSSVSYIQSISDELFSARKTAREKQIEEQKKAAEEAQKRNPNPGPEPAAAIPQGNKHRRH